MAQLQKLKPLHSAVAREMALGVKLVEICKARGLNYSSWQQITGSELFREEVKRIQGEIEDEVIDAHVNDPVMARLRVGGISAAERLISEIDNTDEELGGKAATRITAASSVLKILGYEKPEQKNVIVLNLSAAKLDSISGIPELQQQPANVNGNS